MPRWNLFATVVAALCATLAFVWAASAESFTDAAGRKVELPAAINRIMPAGPPAAVLLYALAPDKMAGWVKQPTDAEKRFLAAPYRDLPVTGRLTGKESSADAETVRKLKPDVILDVGTVDAEYAALAERIQKETGVPYILLDGSLEKTPETFRLLGKLLGKDGEAAALASYADEIVGPIYAPQQEPPVAGKRLSIYYGRGKDGLTTFGSDSINMEIFKALGFTFIPGGPAPSAMTAEGIIRGDPDVIVALDPGFADKIARDPAWLEVTAVSTKRVFCSPALPFGWVESPPGVNRLLGVRWLRSVVYPSNGGEDLRQVTRDYYKLFYHVDLTDTQLGELLSGCAVNRN